MSDAPLTSKTRLSDERLANMIAALDRFDGDSDTVEFDRDVLLGLKELSNFRAFSLAAHEPRTCHHGAISPKGTMFYAGSPGPEVNLWRCGVCEGVYRGDLTDPRSPNVDLTLRASEPPSTTPPSHDVAALRRCLQFYADGGHFFRNEPEEWDTVSGEPQNFHCDRAGTATVEDGSLAKMALEGKPIAWDEDEQQKLPLHAVIPGRTLGKRSERCPHGVSHLNVCTKCD